MNYTETLVKYSTLSEGMQVPTINSLMSIPLENPNILSLAAGFTDNDALPSELIHEAIEDIRAYSSNSEHLQYGTTQGRPGLRELTCQHIASLPNENESVFDPSLTLISNGSQQSLFFATHSLCNPGDIVLVESPTYFVYLSMLQGLGVKPVGIPVDRQGKIDAEAFSDLIRDLEEQGLKDRIKATYLVAYHANPSSKTLSISEKRSVAEVLLRHDLVVPVIEDGAYRELTYESDEEVPSILSLTEFSEFPKWYLGTYTKPFATGLKIGFGICSQKDWFNKMVCEKGNHDFGSSNFSQAIIENVLRRGKYPGLRKKLGLHYLSKARILHQILSESGISEKGWSWNMPRGGLLFWMQAPESVDTSLNQNFYHLCKDKGVIYVPGNLCYADGKPKNFIRLSIGALSDQKLTEAAERFCEAASNC